MKLCTGSLPGLLQVSLPVGHPEVGVFSAGVSSTSEGLIAGSSAGVVAGGLLGIGGRSRFERAWIACMESRGYAIVAPSGAIQ